MGLKEDEFPRKVLSYREILKIRAETYARCLEHEKILLDKFEENSEAKLMLGDVVLGSSIRQFIKGLRSIKDTAKEDIVYNCKNGSPVMTKIGILVVADLDDKFIKRHNNI